MDKQNVDIRNIPITLQIGKAGMSEPVLLELEKQLEKRKFVKVRLLRSFLGQIDKEKACEELAERTKSLLIARTGFIIVLYRPTKKETLQATLRTDV